ncbi:MAG: parvulin-like peptidyl-prolyl isomerase [Polyangiales bacterium]|jgi:parvulin-like peptidyl-prolyl isomerase
MTVSRVLFLSLVCSFAWACDEEPASQENVPNGLVEETETHEEPPDEVELPAEAVVDPNEACARAVVVAWQGAPHAAETVTRSKEEAQTRAEALLARVRGGEAMADIARAESDAASSGPRGGLLGTYVRADWPGAHEVLAPAVFATLVGETTDVIEAAYGYAFAERCAVEKVHTRHILLRYAGARNAGDDIERSQGEARAAAVALQGAAMMDGVDFEALARQHSEDSSAENGGDIGSVGRGRMAQAYEEAAFALEAGGVSGVVETEFGFHVIQRVE